MHSHQLKRREFIGGFAAVAVLQPVGGVAQVAPKRPLVAYLVGGSKSAVDRYFGGFSQGMRELGYVAGTNYAFDGRYADGDFARILVRGGEDPLNTINYLEETID